MNILVLEWLMQKRQYPTKRLLNPRLALSPAVPSSSTYKEYACGLGTAVFVLDGDSTACLGSGISGFFNSQLRNTKAAIISND
jgi:hypothetical protein